jgi:hypothetical protein
MRVTWPTTPRLGAGRQPRACVVDSRLKGPVALALHRVRVGRAPCEKFWARGAQGTGRAGPGNQPRGPHGPVRASVAVKILARGPRTPMVGGRNPASFAKRLSQFRDRSLERQGRARERDAGYAHDVPPARNSRGLALPVVHKSLLTCRNEPRACACAPTCVLGPGHLIHAPGAQPCERLMMFRSGHRRCVCSPRGRAR